LNLNIYNSGGRKLLRALVRLCIISSFARIAAIGLPATIASWFARSADIT
jgi:hypothetical protein